MSMSISEFKDRNRNKSKSLNKNITHKITRWSLETSNSRNRAAKTKLSFRLRSAEAGHRRSQSPS